jgi:ribosomal protein S18 acetylase RimI-like enzyme
MDPNDGELPLHPKRIEEVSLNSWPALQQILYNGWILRFAKGYTKRANSVNPLFGSNLDVEEKITFCEKRYAEKGLRSIFRITPFSAPAELDGVLERRNYRKIDPTLVLHLDLKGRNIPVASAVELRNESLDDWIDIFCQLTASPVAQHQTHKEILQAIPSTRFLASLADSGQIVACALGVLEGYYFGLFDLFTDPQHRSKGYGTQLTSSLLDWAREKGAQHAYLQVMRSNAPARHLYTAKLGFEQVYRYWYRISNLA